MDAPPFDELEFFRAIEGSGARALLIGRRALVLLGLPVLTADYDYWIDPDDAGAFNEAAAPFGLVPTHDPGEALLRGRYVLENDERVDVLVARTVPMNDGGRASFGDLWERRRSVGVGSGVHVTMPALDDLIATKRFSSRPKDVEDIRMLQVLKAEGGL